MRPRLWGPEYKNYSNPPTREKQSLATHKNCLGLVELEATYRYIYYILRVNTWDHVVTVVKPPKKAFIPPSVISTLKIQIWLPHAVCSLKVGGKQDWLRDVFRNLKQTVSEEG